MSDSRADKDVYYRCPKCGGESRFPQGCVSKCGWVPPWTERWEANRKAKVIAYGPRIRKAMTRAERESIYIKDTPRGHACPVCNGKGWTTSACNSCYLCLGKGRVNAITLRSVKR
jgi:hypothetical protein